MISARRSEEVTLEGLRRVLAQLEPPAPRPPRRTPQDTPELVVSGGLAGALSPRERGGHLGGDGCSVTLPGSPWAGGVGGFWGSHPDPPVLPREPTTARPTRRWSSSAPSAIPSGSRLR